MVYSNTRKRSRNYHVLQIRVATQTKIEGNGRGKNEVKKVKLKYHTLAELFFKSILR
jgi:hypothetical protein